MNNVMLCHGLRIHICPKVATASISGGTHRQVICHVPPDMPGEEYRWMCVRHPLDRLVSAWAFFCNSETDAEITGQHDIEPLGYYWGMPFDEFLDLALEKHDLNNHTKMQVTFAGPHEFDKLARFENLAVEWEKLRKHIPYLHKLKHTHKSEHDAWMDYYEDSKMWNKAMDTFRADVELYGKAE